MNRSSLSGLVAAALLAIPLIASAADGIPDVKGKWVGKSHAIVAGQGGHWPKSKGNFAKPLFAEKDFVFEIAGQEGRRFWGVSTLSGNGEKTSEPFIAMLHGKDNRSVLMADTDGYLNAELTDDDTMTFCYAHAGGKTKSTVVSCSEVKRAR